MSNQVPQDPPPPYSPAEESGIPPPHRRSMEDEQRPLPPNWVRQFDTASQHQFFVDTAANPPRAIWHHPYDDDQYLSTLTHEERTQLYNVHSHTGRDEPEGPQRKHDAASSRVEAQPEQEVTGLHKIGRHLKDKLTNSTHEERMKERQQRAEEEAAAYRAHLAVRRALVRALETGQPQLIGRDRDGKDVYIEPPNGPAPPRGAYGYNPYAQGPYTNPNVRFVRPSQPYYRPYGYGYGGGFGLPLATGLVGGTLLGGLLF